MRARVTGGGLWALVTISATLWGADPVIGSWRLNAARSSLPGFLIRYDRDGERVSFTTAEGVTYAVPEDGQDHPVSGLPAVDTVAWRRINDYVAQETRKKAGRVVLTSRVMLSLDGARLTIAQTQRNARGEPSTRTLNYDRYVPDTGERDVPLNTWRLNQAQSGTARVPLRYEPHGSDGVIGSEGEMRYTAAYDGQPHPVAGTADYDAVTLRRVDERTVEERWHKGGALIRTRTRAVSGDGRSLTVTDVRANGGGQPSRHVLVYERQVPAATAAKPR